MPELVCARDVRLNNEMNADVPELHARSAFSFLEGASIPEELIAVCAEHGMPSMALLDRDGVYGSPRFHLAGEEGFGERAHRRGGDRRKRAAGAIPCW